MCLSQPIKGFKKRILSVIKETFLPKGLLILYKKLEK